MSAMWLIYVLKHLKTKINDFCIFKLEQYKSYMQSYSYTHYTHTLPESLVHAQKACTNLKAHDNQVKLATYKGIALY